MQTTLNTPRRTKIVATLGPASNSPEVIDKLLKAGVDVVRLNFSHGTADDHRKLSEMVLAAARKAGRFVAILADLQGPKIRVAKFREGKVTLVEGARFCLDIECPDSDGDIDRVGVTYPELVSEVSAGNELVLDDGRVILEVDSVNSARIECIVRVGGELSDSKGINLRGGGLSADALTEKDRIDIKTAAEMGVDYLAVSFPRHAEDMRLARRLMLEAGGHAGVVAKIERAEALDNLAEIIEASDAVMIARGDLGVEIGDAKLPALQKEIINLTRRMNRVVITATQMMESMRDNPIPTRAEVFDVANAVLDGTDAVMLSAETASGSFPVQTVKAMSEICFSAERRKERSGHRIDSEFKRVDEAIAMAAMYTANHLKARAIATLTESGSTSLWMSRISSGIPIYALSRHESTNRKVNLYRGVFPVYFPTIHTDHAEANLEAVEIMKAHNTVTDGDLVIITKGDLMGTGGGTNAMKIVEVGRMPRAVS